MKLYTEEQVKKAIEMSRSSYNFFTTPFIYSEHEVIQQLKSIEIPSDDEIISENQLSEFNSEDVAYYNGAKWMRDKIQRR
jgi:hypothetical protein